MAHAKMQLSTGSGKSMAVLFFQNTVSEVSGLTLNIPRTHSGQWVFHLLFFLILNGGNYYENL